jgi:hypothetical protein
VTFDAALVVSDDELGVLWAIAGRPLFGYAPPRELDEAAWRAVLRGLVARGFIEDGDPPQLAADVQRLVGVALFADQMLQVTVNHYGADGGGDSSQDVVWRRGESLVRQTPTPNGLHRFSALDRAAIDALLAEALAFPAVDGARTGEPQTLGSDEYRQGLAQLVAEGADAAVARHPSLAGFADALQHGGDGTIVMLLDGALEGGELSFTASPQHGLWVRRDGGDDTVVLQRVSPETAREQVAELVRAFG